MAGDNDEDDGLDQARRDLRAKLSAILEKLSDLRETITTDPFLSAKQKTVLIKRIGDATAFISGIVDHQYEDILNFEDSISDAETRFAFIEKQIRQVKQIKLREAKEELDCYARNCYVNDTNQIENSKLYILLMDTQKSLDDRLQSINASSRYQKIKEYNNKIREELAEKAVSTVLTEITAYIDKREGNAKKPSKLRGNKLEIARIIRTELEKKDKSVVEKIQTVDSILNDRDNAKIFSKRGNVFKRGAEHFLGHIKSFLKDNSEENALCSYFFAPPRAAILQKSLENILDPVLSKPKT